MRNDYEIRGEVTAIFVRSTHHGMMETLISTRKLEKVNAFTGTWYVDWCKRRDYFRVQGTISVNNKTKMFRLHRWITNAPRNLMVDHIDKNSLNNTDENLRLVTNAQNKQNLRIPITNKSGVRGVHWSKKLGKWVAQCSINGRTTHIGCFWEIEDAQVAIVEARRKYMPFSTEVL